VGSRDFALVRVSRLNSPRASRRSWPWVGPEHGDARPIAGKPEEGVLPMQLGAEGFEWGLSQLGKGCQVRQIEHRSLLLRHTLRRGYRHNPCGRHRGRYFPSLPLGVSIVPARRPCSRGWRAPRARSPGPPVLRASPPSSQASAPAPLTADASRLMCDACTRILLYVAVYAERR
jgi:hypothetical protein